MDTNSHSSAPGTAIVAAGRTALLVKNPTALPPLSPDELQRARELAAGLVPTEERLGDIIKFGGDLQAALADTSKTMLAGVRVKALEEVLQLSEGVLAQVRLLNLDELVPTARRTLLILKESTGAIQRRVARFFRGYELVSRRLDRHEADLFRKEAEATRRFHAHAELDQVLRRIMRDAQIGVAAIQLFLGSEAGWDEQEQRQRAAVHEQEAAQHDGRTVDFAVVSAAERYAKYIERVEMKRTSLQQVVLSAYQSEITIRMLQDNENVIRQKLGDIRTDLLPQWRTRITLAYNAYLQQGIAGFVQGLERADAELRAKTADQIARSADSVADLMTRQVFDPVAMKYQQDQLIGALETLKTASTEARRMRAAAEAAMKRLTDELGAAVTAIAKERGGRDVESE